MSIANTEIRRREAKEDAKRAITPKSTWDCDASPQETLQKGTVVVLPHVWSRRNDRTLTPPGDVSVTLQAETTLHDCLLLLEKAALEYVSQYGSDHIRQYYIEKIIRDGNTVEFSWGT